MYSPNSTGKEAKQQHFENIIKLKSESSTSGKSNWEDDGTNNSKRKNEHGSPNLKGDGGQFSTPPMKKPPIVPNYSRQSSGSFALPNTSNFGNLQTRLISKLNTLKGNVIRKKVTIISDKTSGESDPLLVKNNANLKSPLGKKVGWGSLFKLHMEYSDHLVSTLDEFFKVAGFEIYSDEGEEIHLKVISTNKIIKVRRDLFTKYSTPDSSTIEEGSNGYNIMVKTESNLPKNITKNKSKSTNKLSSREIKGDFDQSSLIKSNVSHVEKASEVQGANIHSPIKKESPKGVSKGEEEKEDKNFSNIFNGLEEMSNNSTLFDDFDDDDMPPPLPGTKNLVKNNTEKSKNEEERGQDSSHKRSRGPTPDSMRDSIEN